MATNVITTVVTNSNPYDVLTPRLTATNSFLVAVTDPVGNPMILSVTLTNQIATITWTTVLGHTYELQFKDAAPDTWNVVSPGINASETQASQTNFIGEAPVRFYRIVTSPERFQINH